MAIRIGASCVFEKPEGKVSEVRRFWDDPYDLKRLEAAKTCIKNKIYLILNQCIDNNSSTDYHFPTEYEWRTKIEDDVKKLISYGGNKNNARMTIVNEPTKYLRKEYGRNGVDDLIWLTNIAHDQIGGRFDLGAGNMEFHDAAILGDWYGKLAAQGKMEYLDIHIQNSCDTEIKTSNYTNFALNIATSHKLKLDCTEANSTEWDVSGSDYQKLLMQLKYAEKVKCPNFCIVFLNLTTNTIPGYHGQWDEICFKINGVFRNDGCRNNYNNLMGIMEAKAPIPNIVGEEDMRLDTIYKEGSQGIGVKFIQKVLNEDIKPEPLLKVDGIWGPLTNGIVLIYQAKYNLSQYAGAIGPNTMQDMIKNYPDIWNNIQYLYCIGVR